MSIDRNSYELELKFHKEIYDLKNGFRKIASIIKA